MNSSADMQLSTRSIDTPGGKERLAVTGSLIGAIAASSCCVLPLVLFSVGAGGVWIGRLTALAPYQPYIIAVTLGFLGYGFWQVYFKPPAECEGDQTCSRPIPNRIVRLGLWSATILVFAALVFPYAAPVLLG